MLHTDLWTGQQVAWDPCMCSMCSAIPRSLLVRMGAMLPCFMLCRCRLAAWHGMVVGLGWQAMRPMNLFVLHAVQNLIDSAERSLHPGGASYEGLGASAGAGTRLKSSDLSAQLWEPQLGNYRLVTAILQAATWIMPIQPQTHALAGEPHGPDEQRHQHQHPGQGAVVHAQGAASAVTVQALVDLNKVAGPKLATVVGSQTLACCCCWGWLGQVGKVSAL